MSKIHIRERLKNGDILIGGAVGIPHPTAVEIAGYAGFDFVFLDTEHSALGVTAIEPMILAGRVSGVASIYRVRQAEHAAIGRALDLGADGVLVPHVASVDKARAVVDAARYAPLGRRGMGPGRQIKFGLTDAREYLKTANQQALVAVMIEDREAVENIEAIAAVEGIDVFNIGTCDLSNALGVPFQTRHPKVLEAIGRIGKAAKANGIALGVPPECPEEVAELVEMGCRFFEFPSVQTVLAEGLRDIVRRCTPGSCR
jgi:2-keto-3-deoxy-L-rhamnonate aldolase RhmA